MANSIRKAYVDTPQGQIHYRHVSPSNKPRGTVVMFHKSASSSVSYEAIMKILATKDFSCFALDMPGFGNSFDPETVAAGTKWYVDVFISAMETLGLMQRDLHLMGHHSGASLAPEVATTRPDSVASVCLIGTAVMSAAERAEMKKKYFAPFNKPVEDGSHLTKTWEYLKGMGVGQDIDLFQREAVDHVRAWKGRNQIYGAVWGQDLAEHLDSLRCPVMFICAKDDVLWDYQERAKARWPDAKYAECSGANFSLDLDAETIVREWLDFIAM